MNVGTAIFKAVADFSDVVKQSKEASKSLENVGDAANSTDSRAKGFWNFIQKAVAGIGKVVTAGAALITGFFTHKALTSGYERLTNIQDATAALGVQMGDTAKAGDLLGKIMDVVTGTGYNFDGFAKAGANLVSFGVAAEKVPKYLTAIGESAASRGSEAQDYADRLATVFGKVQAQGKIMGDDINQMSAVGVNGLAILANGFGVSAEEMRKMISKGVVPAGQALDMLADGIINGSDGMAGATVKFGGTMEAMRQTLSGAKGGFESAVARFGANVIKPFLGLMTEGYTSSAATLDKWGKSLNAGLQAMVDSPQWAALFAWFGKIPTAVQDAWTWLQWAGGNIAQWWQNVGSVGLDTGTWDRLKGIWEGLATAANSIVTPLESIALTLINAASAVSISLWQTFLSVMESLVPIINNQLVPAVQALADWMATNQDTVNKLVQAYVIFAGARTSVGLVKDAWEALAKVKEKVVTAFDNIKDAVQITGDVLNTVWNGPLKGVQTAFQAFGAGFAGDLNKIDSYTTRIQSLAVSLGGTLSKAVDASIRGFVDFTNAARNASTTGNLFTGGLKLMKDGIISGTVALAKQAVQLAKNTALWLAQNAKVAAAAVVQGVVKVATVTWTAVQWLLNAAMNANPMGIIIMAIMALIAAFVLLWNNCEPFRDFMISMWEGIQAAVKVVVDWFTTNLLPIFQKIWDGVSTYIGLVWKFWTAVFEGIWAVVSGVFGIIWEIISGIVKLIWTLVSTYFQLMWDFWSWVFTSLWNIIQWVWNTIWGFLEPIVQQIWSWIQSFLEWISTTWNTVWEAVSSFFQGVWNAIWSFLEPIVQQIWSWIQSFLDWISTTWNTVWDAVSSTFSAVWNAIWAFLEPIIKSITDGIGTALDWISTTWNTVWNSVSSFFSNIWNGITSFVSTSVEKVKNFIGNLQDLPEKVRAWFESIKTGIKEKFDDAVEFVKGIPDKIVAALGKVKDLLLDAGKAIIDGFLDGLKKAFNGVKDWVGGIGSWIADHKGPKAYDLALLVPAGNWIITGLREGIQAQIPGLLDDVSQVADAVSGAFSDAFTMDMSGLLGTASADVALSAQPTSTLDPRLYQGSADSGGLNVDQLIIQNPLPERATDSLAMVARRQSYGGVNSWQPA